MAVMIRDNGTDNRQSEAGSPLFGGKIGLKKTISVFRGDPDTGIHNFNTGHLQQRIVIGPDLDRTAGFQWQPPHYPAN